MEIKILILSFHWLLHLIFVIFLFNLVKSIIWFRFLVIILLCLVLNKHRWTIFSFLIFIRLRIFCL